MRDLLLDFYRLLTDRQRRHFVWLQLVMVVASLLELVGVTSVVPFIVVASDAEAFEKYPIIRVVYDFFEFTDVNTFLVFLVACFIVVVVFVNAFQVLSLYLLNRYAYRVGGEFSQQLNRYYLSQPFLFHVKVSSAELINKIMVEPARLSELIVAPILRLNAKVFSILCLAGFLTYISPEVALIAVVVLGLTYSLVLVVTKYRSTHNGALISRSNELRLKILTESYEGIKEVKLTNSQKYYSDLYAENTRVVSRAMANNMILGQGPYYIIEMIALSGGLLIALFLILSVGTLGSALPLLAMYMMAGYKLIPAFQQSYNAIAAIRSARVAFVNLKSDLLQSKNLGFYTQANRMVEMAGNIKFNSVTYKYPYAICPLFENVNLEFPEGKVTALIGASGVGKTTLINLLLTLVEPTKGQISVGEVELVPAVFSVWRENIGFVPQDVHILDASLCENVAFGVRIKDIDVARVHDVLSVVGLMGAVSLRSEGVWAGVGSRGLELSGGQRQRLAVARALYRGANYLVMDEMTSSLDEQTTIDMMNEFSKVMVGRTLVVITHNTSLVDYADVAYEVCEGGVIRSIK